jgi:hypothetical protein
VDSFSESPRRAVFLLHKEAALAFVVDIQEAVVKDIARTVFVKLCTGVMALTLVSVAAVPASADSISVNTTSLGGQALNSTGLDHHQAYTWSLNGVNISGGVATSATLTFFNFYNWTSQALDPNNIIFLSLLDGTQSAQTTSPACTGTVGITCTSDSMTDNGNGGTLTIHDISNAFQVSQDALGVGNVSVIGAAGMVASATPITYLGSSRNTADAGQSAYGYNPLLVGNNPGGLNGTGAFTDATHVTWSYTFNSAQLAALTTYINNGAPVAFGLDPDCHFFMDSIQFDMAYAPGGPSVPEPASLTLLATGVAYLWMRRKKNAHVI